MNIEQQQKLSELTEEAIQQNDIESLAKIWDIIRDDQKNGEMIGPDFGVEWFESMVPPEMMISISELSKG